MPRALGSMILCVSTAACVLSNPVFGDHESESGSASEGTSVASASTSTTGGAAASSSGASTGGSASAGETGSTGAASTTTLSPGSDGSGSSSGEGSTTGVMEEQVLCDPAEQLVVTIDTPTENTYVVTSGGANCPWTDSNLQVLNNTVPCETLNFGSPIVKYTLVGTSGGARSEYLARFAVYETMQAFPAHVISYAQVEIVPWWAVDRTNLVFHAALVAPEDRWVVGDKAAQPATIGDSTWIYRWIEDYNASHLWTSGLGPAAGATPGGTIEIPFLAANDHPWHKSSPIPGPLFTPWLASPEAGQGIVISTDDAPILVKNKEAGYPPRLHLTLCPLP